MRSMYVGAVALVITTGSLQASDVGVNPVFIPKSGLPEFERIIKNPCDDPDIAPWANAGQLGDPKGITIKCLPPDFTIAEFAIPNNSATSLPIMPFANFDIGISPEGDTILVTSDEDGVSAYNTDSGHEIHWGTGYSVGEVLDSMIGFSAGGTDTIIVQKAK